MPSTYRADPDDPLGDPVRRDPRVLNHVVDAVLAE
jgi:hypothetical protein